MCCSKSRILSFLGLDKIFWAVYKILCVLYPDVLHSITQMSNKREYQKHNLNFRFFLNEKKNLSSSYTFIQYSIVFGWGLPWKRFFLKLGWLLSIVNCSEHFELCAKFWGVDILKKCQHLCSLIFSPFQAILNIFYFFRFSKK